MKAVSILLLAYILGFLILSYFNNATAATDISVRNLIVGCSSCHGYSGKGLGEMPSLRGYDQGLFVNKMKWFAKSPKNGDVMHYIARGYSENDLRKMAEFYANK